MARNASKIIATREFDLYKADWVPANVMPADTVPYGGITTPYTQAGYTIGGLGMQFQVNRGAINVDQEVDPVLTPVTGRVITLNTNLAEITTQNLGDSAGLGTQAAVPAASGTRGHNDLVIGSGVVDKFQSTLFEAQKQDGEAFRALVYKGQATGSPNVQIRPEAAAQIAYQIGARVDSSTSPARVMLVRDVVAALA